jgi:membrane-bound ClpP family serine protease
MKHATTVCIGLELLFLGAVIWSYSVHIILGVVMTGAWLLSGGLLFIIGTELDEHPEQRSLEKKSGPKFANLIGSSGKTISVLNPAGMIKVGDEKVEAKAFRGLIKPQKSVIIVDAKANIVIVKEQEN